MTKIRRASSGPFEGAFEFVDREFPDQIIYPGIGIGFVTPPQGNLRPRAAFATILSGATLDARLVVSKVEVNEDNGTIITFLTNVHTDPLNPVGIKYRLTLVE